MKTRNIIIAMVLMVALLLCGCSQGTGNTASSDKNNVGSSVSDNESKDSSTSDKTSEVSQNSKTDEASQNNNTSSGSRTLVVYFSRTGEQYNVGVIEKGNTEIVAEMIAEKTNADLYEIKPATDYPYTHSELLDAANQEKNSNARPAIGSALPVMSKYDTVFIGAPVWWGDWPMIMYTFFESTNLSGKKLIPFSTHEGSGLSGFDSKLSAAVPDAEVLTGLAIQGSDCQNDKDGVKATVDEWISGLGLS